MSVEQEVIALVVRKTGISASKITPEKTLYQLGIDGDDAVELVDEVCERYHVRVDKVDLNKYIGPEAAFTVSSNFFNAVMGDAERRDLRISDLIKTAEVGRWFDIS